MLRGPSLVRQGGPDSRPLGILPAAGNIQELPHICPICGSFCTSAS
jgi:hypothetical protein